MPAAGGPENQWPPPLPHSPWTYLSSCSGHPTSSQSALQMALQTGSLLQPACHPDSNASKSASRLCVCVRARVCVPGGGAGGDPSLQPPQLLP